MLKFNEYWSLTNVEIVKIINWLNDEKNKTKIKLFEKLEKFSQINYKKLMKQYNCSKFLMLLIITIDNAIKLIIKCCY